MNTKVFSLCWFLQEKAEEILTGHEMDSKEKNKKEFEDVKQAIRDAVAAEKKRIREDKQARKKRLDDLTPQQKKALDELKIYKFYPRNDIPELTASKVRRESRERERERETNNGGETSSNEFFQSLFCGHMRMENKKRTKEQ